MKKKIISLLTIFLILFTNYAFAITVTTDFDFQFERRNEDSNSSKLNTIAKVKDNNTRIGSEYTALTSITSNDKLNKSFTSGNIVVYNQDSGQSEEPCYYTTTKKFYVVDDGTDIIDRYITLQLSKTTKKINFSSNEFYIIYKNAVSYEGKKYNLKLELNSIACKFDDNDNTDSKNEIFFHAGRYDSDGQPLGFYPGVGTSGVGTGTEIKVTQTVLDDNGNEVPVSGFFAITDVDLEQGIAIKNLELNNQNVFMEKESTSTTSSTDTIRYYIDNDNNATYIYSTTNSNLEGNIGNVYVLLQNKSKLNMTFTFGTKGAHSTVGYIKGPNYYKIDKIIKYENEEDATTTSVIDNINPGETKTVSDYPPKDDTYYLKSIKVNGVSQPLSTSTTIENINENKTIEILYAKKYKVEFDSKEGTAVPTQYVIPNGKATIPAEPTRSGYTFRGWYTSDRYTTLYDFNTQVNEDKILYAKWDKNDVYHNITYIVLGTPDDNNVTDNPTRYKEGDTTTLTIKEPTKQGYTFSGWRENQTSEGSPVTRLNVTGRTEDITLYGRWTINEEPSAAYQVRHFFENENGTYTIDNTLTENKTGKVGNTVTAEAVSKVGFTAKNNTLNGVVKQDGSLKLDFYYDKIQYTVTFDTKGGTPVPEQQTKKYRETVTKPSDPTKNGYSFLYWYEVINGVEVPYDFSTPVTSNKTLIAKWQEVTPEDIYHNINYIIDGTPDNSAGNPERFKEGSTTPLTIYNPTKHGYTFSGWKDNQSLTGNSISTLDVSNKRTDITLYGKWTKNIEPNSNYIVNHYLQDENGTVTKDNKKYKLSNTETKQAKTDSTVTENAQTFEGYEAEKSSLSGIVTEDGSLVLNFYYNKKQYKITFDSKGGTKVDNQTKIYGEKVDKPTDPTKDGYKFLYWYEIKDGKRVIYDFDSIVKSDKELIAEWEEIKIIPDDPTSVPTQKTDTTVAQKIIPNTGAISTAIIIISIILIGAFFGIRYFKLRNDMK